MILRKNEDLTLQEAVELLHNAAKNPTEMVSFIPPVKPSTGDVFVYLPGENLQTIGKTIDIRVLIYGKTY